MPYSADFYAKGSAKDIPDSSKEKILAEIYDNNEDFFVIKEDQQKYFPKQAQEATSAVGSHKEYFLRREIK